MSADKRAANRARCPEFTEFVDAMRQAFGDVKVRYVRWPDGSEEGNPMPDGVPISARHRAKARR